MKSLTYLAFATTLLLPTGAVLALPVKTVPSNNLQGMVIKVWAGYDLSMDFVGSGEVVTNAVIGNPSIVLGGLGGTLCPRISTSEQECNNTGAPAIYLRQTKIDPQSSYLLSSKDGKTSLILTTNGPEGIKNYVLTIVPARGNPEYAGLEIQSPVVQEPPPVLPPPPVRQPLPIVQAPSQPTDIANTPQWQAQPPTTVSQANSAPSVVSLPPAATGANPPIDAQQVTPIPSPNIVTPTDVVTVTPKTTPVPKRAESITTERPSQNAIAPDEQPTPDESALTSAQQEQTVKNPTSAKPSNNSSTQGETHPNNVKTPTRTTQLPTINTNELANSSNSIEQATAIVAGLQQARQKGQINYGTTTWKEVQSVVKLLRRGKLKQEAAQEVGVPLKLIDQLLVWGSSSTFTTTSN